MATIKDAAYYIERLKLILHPEGGFFRESYRSDWTIPKDALPSAFGGDRQLCTSIYFLLCSGAHSTFHRIKSDELWHFHDGTSLKIHSIDVSGTLTTHRLGRELEAGDQPQVIVPAGMWFAAELLNPSMFCLCGCTVSPGFAFDDFEMADVLKLSAAFPQHTDLIRRLS